MKAWLLLGGFVTLPTALGWWAGGFRPASVSFVVALLIAATVYWYGPRIVLASLGARELLLAERPQLHSSVERLALAAGVGRSKEPPVYFDHYQPWNEQQYERRREWTSGRVLAELQEQSARYLALVKSLHEEDLNRPIRFPWDEQGTVHALVVEGLKHRGEHREQLAAALG